MTAIIIFSYVLSIVAPLAFGYVLMDGVRRAQFDATKQTRLNTWLISVLTLWVVTVFALTMSGVFEYQIGDKIPRFMVALLVPTMVLMLLLLNKTFRHILDHTPVYAWSVGQFFRLFGVVFFLVASLGLGPSDLITSGYGDLLTGILAITAGWMLFKRREGAIRWAWIFTTVGMLDLVNLSVILLRYYPIWSDYTPSTAGAGAFPLVLIVGITAPIALIMHVYMIRTLINKKSQSYEVATSD